MNKKHRKCQIRIGGKSITNFLYSLYDENSRTHTDVVSHSGSYLLMLNVGEAMLGITSVY